MKSMGKLSGLAATLLAAQLALSGCDRVEIRTGPARAHDVTHAGASPVRAPDRDAGPLTRTYAPSDAPAWSPEASASPRSEGLYTLPGMDCLVNDDGIRIKVIATEPGVRCLETVPSGLPAGNPLRYFHPYFVFDRWPADGPPEHYLVGSTPRRSSIIGWAPAYAATRWDTRVGVRYKRSDDPEVRVPTLLVYGGKQPLIDYLETGVLPDEQPLARATPTAQGRTLMPWPVAETELVNVRGQMFELVRINFLAQIKQAEGGIDLAATPEKELVAPATYAPAEVAQLRRGVKMLDIVFCVDNTHSTGDFIVGIREAVKRISQELQTLPFRPDVSFGLVLYRDYVDGVYFDGSDGRSVVRSFPLERDLGSFLSHVEPLREARLSSDDWAEAGYDGLYTALAGTRWRDALAARCVVLIGDNRFHEPESEKNPSKIGLGEIERAAQSRGIKVFSLAIDGKGGDEEQALLWSQFEAIARVTGGTCHRLTEAQRVVGEIASIMDVETNVVQTRATVFDDLAIGRSAEQIAADHEMDIEQVTEVMEFLGGAGVDFDKLKPGVPSFATGWALTEMNGVPLVEREVYVARAEVDVLLGALNLLCSHLSPDFGRQAFGMGLAGRINPVASFLEGEVPEPLDVFLMAKGIPVARSSILRRDSNEIRHMPEQLRNELRQRIAKHNVPSLVNARNDESLWSLRDGGLDFGWIPEKILP